MPRAQAALILVFSVGDGYRQAAGPWLSMTGWDSPCDGHSEEKHKADDEDENETKERAGHTISPSYQ